MLRKSTATCAQAHTTHSTRPTHTSKSKSKATARRGLTRLKPGKGPPGCLGSAGEGHMHAKPGTRLGSDGAVTPSFTSTHTHTSTHTALLQNASNDASSLTRRRYAEQEEAEQVVHVGGMRGSHDSPAALQCFAPADSTREVSTGRIGRTREVRARLRVPHAWSGRPRTQGSGLTSAGGARYGGLGWAGKRTAKAQSLDAR
jgi:hypothetical protein